MFHVEQYKTNNMKAIKLFFELLASYQQLKYSLKENFERIKFELSIEYAARMNKINNTK
jgi:hypothetical protein